MAEKKSIEKNFQYTGKNSRGQKITGLMRAKSLAEAKLRLKRQGIRTSKIKLKRPSLFTKTKKLTTVTAADIASFARQIATLQAAGVPLVQGLEVIIGSSSRTGLVALTRDIKLDIEAGATFAEALRKQPTHFDDLFCNLVEAGEQSGSLEEMLDRIALYKEKVESIKRKIKKAMYYPITVLVIGAAVAAVLLIKVVPTFKDLFAGFGAELPTFTLMVLNLSEALQNHGLIILGGLGIAGYLSFFAYKTQKKLRDLIERLSLKLPTFGNILHNAALARFARTLSTTFMAGVPLTDSLISVAKASGNIVYQDAILKIRDKVTAGQSLQNAMRSTGLFPGVVVQMVAIGEESGSLGEMLGKVANIYEEEVDMAIDGLSSLLEPIIMVILGIMVGGLVIAMYLPIFKMGSVF